MEGKEDVAAPQHSDNVDEELHRVHLALHAVFAVSSSNPTQQQQLEWGAQRQLADRYLTSFQSQPISWMVCDRLLQEAISPNNDLMIQQQRCFFAAQTLHTKCCNDIFELPSESLPSLRDSLLSHLKRYSGSDSGGMGSDSALKNRLAMCVSVLAIQMGWTTIVSDLLSTESNYDVSMSILRALPEECASDRILLIDENARYKMRDHLVSSAPAVFAYLQTLHEQHNMTETVFKVFFIWIRYVPVQPSALVETSLLARSIRGLNEARYLEVAADVVVEVLHMYPSHHFGNDALVKLMIPELSLLPLDDVLRSGDEDLMRVYCRVVTEMGESYMSLILSPDYQQSSKLVDWVLRCSEIHDSEISSITFHFWYSMVMDLEGCEPFEWRQDLIDFYSPHLLKLIDICAKNLMKYPQDIEDAGDDRMDDLKNHRFYVSETIQDCCRLLGGDLVLKQCGRFLRDEVNLASSRQQSDWHGLESGLACIGALHNFVPADEDDILPFCFNLVPHLPPEARLLRYTASKVIGNYAFWLATHPHLLQPLLPYLSQGLQIRECASAAATAIKEMCICSNKNFDLAEPVLHLYEEFASQPGRLDVLDELQILEGVCRALSRTIQDTLSDGRDFLIRLAQPIGSRLAKSIESANVSPHLVIAEMDRLAIISSFLMVPFQPGKMHPLVELTQSVWSLLDSAINLFPKDFAMAEKVCRLHKNVLRACGTVAYSPMVDTLMQQLVRSFEKTRLSPFLYLASICITEYSKDTSIAQRLYNMVEAMANIVFSFLRTFDEVTAHPDVVEELFYLMARMMDNFPDVVAASHLLQPLFKCAAVTMQLDHPGAHKGALKFLDSTVSYGMKLREQNKPECQNALQTVFAQNGGEIVLNLIRILVGDLPSYSNQAPEILWKLTLLCPSLLSEWLAAAFDLSSLPVPERAKAEFVAAIDLKLSRDDFNCVATAFRSACDRERRVRRMAQQQARRK